MTLPDVCPRDGVSRCKKKDCHLYVVEWRTGDEQCIIGYRLTHKELSRSAPLEDTYAESTRQRLGKTVRPRREDEESGQTSDTTERHHLQRQVRNVENVICHSSDQHSIPTDSEEIVFKNKNTTVIESRHGAESPQKADRKRRSVEEMMDLDLPENYEEEFWK
ncbi:MAG: hypothetical protein QCH31_06040 [Methanolobus sp.]|nr:hypothetical protein [Methanolobus sp.]